MSETRCPAVVLATRPLGDADLLVVMLTPDLGKVRAAARAARKSRKRFAGGLPGGALGEATLRPGRSGLWRLEGFASTHDLGGLGRDLDRFAYVAYVCEVTDVLVVEPEPDAERFAALATTMESILVDGPRPSVLRRFELRMLDTLGLLPSLDVCCICGALVLTAEDERTDPGIDPEKETGREIPFDGERGGVLCFEHAGRTAPDLLLTEEVLRLAAALADAQSPQTVLGDVDAAPPSVRRALRDLAAGLVRAHLRRPLRSLEFLAQLGSAKAGS